MVAQEVNRNLTTTRHLRLSSNVCFLSTAMPPIIIDEPVPRELVSKYIELGIPEKADAFIGAFVDWLQIPYLISANRHFFRNLQIEAFRVLNVSEFQANLREDMP